MKNEKFTAPIEVIRTTADGLGVDTCRPFFSKMLMPEKRIRGFCRDNRCGRFGRHYMCPPAVGTLEDTVRRIGKYQNGLLVQCIYPLDVQNDPEKIRWTKSDFHNKVLHLEAELRKQIPRTWALIGGDRALCDPCFAAKDAPCPYPDRARPSLESLGIDVITLLANLDLDTGFHADRLTWTGCLLY